MQLKAKILNFYAGIPASIINLRTAKKLGIHTGDRISISKNSKRLTVVVDTISNNTVLEDEIALSSEVLEIIKIKNGALVDIDFVEPPESLKYIKEKLQGKTLNYQKLYLIIKDILSNNLSEAGIALFVSGMFKNGMSFRETTDLIKAILETGNKIKISGKYTADKHCIGGVPGNRTTPIVVSICAADGVIIPKSSSRAITSAAGTADVIETVAEVSFSINEIKKIIKKTNACLVWGGALGLVPADSQIIKVEKKLSIDPEAQLLASIFSKKLASGAKNILIDIPYGENAKVDKVKALRLKRKFELLGKYFNRNVKVVLTNGEQPIGNGVGPTLELFDVISVLDPNKTGPNDLEEKSIFLAGEILELVGKVRKGNGKKRALEILKSGLAYKKFIEIISAQRGSLNKLSLGKIHKTIRAYKTGFVKKISNQGINLLARVAGCPLDKKAGVYLHVLLNQKINVGDPLITLYAHTKEKLKQAELFFRKNNIIEIK